MLSSEVCSPRTADDGTSDEVTWSLRSQDREKVLNDLLASQKIEEFIQEQLLASAALRKAAAVFLNLPICRNTMEEAADLSCIKRFSERLLSILSKESAIHDWILYQEQNSKQRGTNKVGALLHNPHVASLVRRIQLKLLDRPETRAWYKESELVFADIKREMVQFITHLKVDGQAGLVQKLESTGLGSFEESFAHCTEVPSLVTSIAVSAHYDNLSLPKKVKICPSFFYFSRSRFSLAMLLGHELGHSIDPCNYRNGISNNLEELLASYPLKKVFACLKRNEGTSRTLTIADLSRNCERMADWLGAEVMLRYIQKSNLALSTENWRSGLINAMKWACDGRDSKPTQDYPTAASRINTVLQVHPEVRNRLNCAQPSRNYCHVGP